MGEICRMKANKVSESAVQNKIKIEPLFIRQQSRRSYLVFTSPRVKVTVNDTDEGRVANCQCRPAQICQHIELVAKVDNQRFPQTGAAK